MSVAQSSVSDRIKAGVGAVALQVGLGYALISGLAVTMPTAVSESLALFELGPEPPPPPVEKVIPERVKSKKPEGAAAPPNLQSKPTEIVAPPPIIPPVVPHPVIAAPVAGVGSDNSAGASDVRGPGTGSGGQGDGTGSGGFGDGGGGGGGTPPRQIRGRINDSDYPRVAGDARIGGTVPVRFVVGTDGRASRCRVTQSSGNAELDDTTCRLIEQRFRFKPARDARGRAVPSTLEEDHTWIIDEREPLED